MDADVQTKASEVDDDKTESLVMVINEHSDVPTTSMSVDEGLFDQDQIEDERLFREVGIEENVMEIAGTMNSVAVKPEGETGQEMSGEFKNIPPGICEGQVVVLQELNFPTCEETQEGVPEYNNGSVSNENTTKRALEEGDCEEIQGSKLPEEVESKEPESLQNSGCRTGADYLLVTEYMEENSFDAGLRGETEKPLVEAVTQESEEEEELLVDSMKPGIEHSEKEFESEIGLTTDEIRMVEKEMQNGSEEILVDYEVDEGLCDSKVADAVGDVSVTTGALTAEETFLKAEGQKMMQTTFFQESVDAQSSGQNSNKTLSLLEDITESVFLKQYDETEPKLLENVAIQVSGIDVQETGDEVEVAAEDETQSKHEIEMLHLKVVGLEESELSRPVGSLETRNQRSDEELEISDEVLTDSEAADKSKTAESKPKDFTLILREMAEHAAESEGSSAEEMVCSSSGSRDVIDEEILDLWLQTPLSECTEVKQQVEPPLGQQLEPSNEWQGDISSVQTEKDEELLVEPNSRESELLSDTEMPTSTVESGFLDQSLSEWGTQNSETPLLITTNTGSVQGIYDMLAIVSEPADLSELSSQQPNSEAQDILMEEVTETGQSYLKEEELIAETGLHPDSGVPSPEPGHLNQESNISPKEEVELVETETRSQNEIDAEVSDWKDTEERDSKSLTEISSLFKVKETKAEDEPLEMIVSESPDEIKHIKSEESRFGSQALFQNEMVLTESGSQANTGPEFERMLPSVDESQPGWSEDVADMAGQSTTKSEDQKEVDSSALDFTAQKSRLSVKNPRVRPPKDPRSLLLMPSLDPTPSPHLSTKLPAGMPLGGLGFGVKLPGLGAGFPVLKKTQRVETKPEERSDTHTQDEAQHKPKWMPPRQPGFGNPLMSELKIKLKKTTKE
ncbi:uro-adherence factor A isoform X2 [Clinocottus analis]|uniref:uro-adherence factor A isoform X2 n=1 Tax=Clinocottus analis TaxID=304258 RepID=UPI0035BF6A1E